MKKNAIYENEEKRQAMRNALIQKIDAALDAKEPDMDTVDLCRALLDALEHGSCQPGNLRMQRELARLAEEIDYIPKANAMVTVKPMTVRKALVGVLAVFMCLLLLPLSVLLLRGGNRGLADNVPSTEDDTATTEAAEVFGGVTFLHGDRVARYDDLAACMNQELPDLYYPTVFPEGIEPTSVVVTEDGEDICTTIGFGDTPYSISVFSWSSEKNAAAKESGYETDYLQYWINSPEYLLLEYNSVYEGDVYRLSVYIDYDHVYEFRVADEEIALAMIESLCRADTDHIHAWKTTLIEIPSEEDTMALERHIWKECSVCGTVETTLPADFEPTWINAEEMDHVHVLTSNLVTVKENGKNVRKVQRVCRLCKEIEANTEQHEASVETTLPPYIDTNGHLHGYPQ